MADRFHINVKTVAKWRKRTSVKDAPMGPRHSHSTILASGQEAMIVAFRRNTLLPLDDCLYALQPSIPNLTRSSLHRCLQRHGISRLPDVDEKPVRKKFAQYPIGYFHIDNAEVNTDGHEDFICSSALTVHPSLLTPNSIRIKRATRLAVFYDN